MEALPLRGEAAETNGGPNKKSKPYLKDYGRRGGGIGALLDESKRLCLKGTQYVRQNKFYLAKIWFCLAVMGKVAFVLWALYIAVGAGVSTTRPVRVSDCTDFEQRYSSVRLRYSFAHKSIGGNTKKRSVTAAGRKQLSTPRAPKAQTPIYFFASYSAHMELVADLTRTMQTLENVLQSSPVHVFLIEIVEQGNKKKQSRLDLEKFMSAHPKITVTHLRALYKPTAYGDEVEDVAKSLQTCLGEVVSKEATNVPAVRRMLVDGGVVYFGRLSNAYDPKLFRLLAEVKASDDDRAAVVFPVSFPSRPDQELFAPIVKDSRLVGFAGGEASDSLTLSGIALPVAYLNSLPASWTVYDLRYNSALVSAYASEIVVYNMATSYSAPPMFRHSRSADLDRTNLFELIVKGERTGIMTWTEREREKAKELCSCLLGECGKLDKAYCGRPRP